MRLLRWIAATVVLVVLSPLTARAPAQQPLHVLRHMPFDSARVGESIIIMFDRPVASSVERAPDPNRFVRVEPALPGVVQWRDPSTIRIIPNEQSPSGRFTITVASTFAADDGGRLEAPYIFTVHTMGPRFLGRIPTASTREGELFDPIGRVTLVYTAPIDTAQLSRVGRLEIAPTGGCVRQTIHYRVTSAEPTSPEEDRALSGRYLIYYDPDQRYRTSVHLQSEVSIPEGCSAVWVVPSFNPVDHAEIRYRAVTMAAFRIASLECTAGDCALTPAFKLGFTAPVRAEALARRVSIEPRTPFTIDQGMPSGRDWVIRLSVKMRTTYRISVDSALEDVFGRKLVGNRQISLAIKDRRPALAHQLGFFTLSRRNPVLRITHVNADSVDLAIVRIPDSLRGTIIAASLRPDSVVRIVRSLRDTVHLVVPLRLKPNDEQLTDIRLPASVLDRTGGGLLAIRARGIWKLPVSPSATIHEPGELPAITILGSGEILSSNVALVQITDLLAHVKVDAAWGSVFVTDVNDGHPVTGAAVTLRDWRGQAASTGMTDATGVADLRRLPQWHKALAPPDPSPDWYYGNWLGLPDLRLIEVTRGSDRLVTVVTPYSRESRLLDAPYPDFSYDRDRFVRGLVYTERPIYRPGERPYVGAILRQGWLGDLTVPSGDSVRVRVQSSQYGPNDSETLRDTVVRLSTMGTAADSFAIPRAATLGGYMVRLEAVIDSSWRTVAWTGFSVAEYRAPEFRTTVALDTGVRFLGDTVRGRIEARYYFGAAMAGAPVNWQASVSDLDDRLAIPGLPSGFVIGREYYDGPNDRSSGDDVSGVDTLDANGSVTLAIPTTPGTLNGPGQLAVNVSVEDLNRATVTATATTVVHPSAYYVAVRDPGRDWYWKQDATRALDVVVVRPSGERVPAVRVQIIGLRHHYVWSAQPVGLEPTATWVTDTVARDSVVTSDSVVRYAYTPRTPGSHELQFTIRDDHDRPLTTTIGRYVVPVRSWWGSEGTRASLSMRVTPDTAAVGDTVRVHFISPFPRSEAWITIEREGILAQRRLTVSQGETVVPFMVSDPLVPGATVVVTLVDSIAAWKTDSLHERIRVARTMLHVGQSPKQLRVDVAAAKDRYEPADSARITVRLRDHLMRPVMGEVTLWAVDESVIALADYETPDPYARMYADRGSGLTFATTAANLANRGRNLSPEGWYFSRYGTLAMNSVVSVATATGGRSASMLLRSNFRTTAFFLHALRTDAAGSVTATIKLPDNLTTYHIFAVAGTVDSRFGAGEASLLVTKPLLARAALPRFVRTGDQLIAGAVLTNQTGAHATVNVRASGRAASIDGTSRTTRSLGADSSAEVRFNWRTTSPPGDTAAFRFDVDGGTGYGDAVLATVPVRPSYSPRYHTITGVARGMADVRMFLPRELDPGRSRLTLMVGTTPVSIIRNNYWRLRVYPYQCSEQLTSSGMGIAAVLQLQRAGLLDSTVTPRAADLRRDLQTAVDELSRRLTDAGGVGYWARTSWTDARLTTYAGSFLLTARELGADVRPRALASIVGYLTDLAIPDPDTTFGDRAARARMVSVHLAEKLARLWYLRRAGVPDTAGEDIIAEREAEMVWEDRVLLARLLGAREDKTAGREVLDRAWLHVGIAGRRLDIPDSLAPAAWWFPSRVRPVARLLTATMELDPSNPHLAAAIESVVSQQRAQRGWWIWNTHDYAAASAALSEIALWQRAAERAGPLTVRSLAKHHRGEVIATGRAGAQSDSAISLAGLVERDGDWLALPLRIEAGDRSVYYSLTVEEIPTSPPTTPDAQGVTVERWFERFDTGRPATEAKEGELVRGRLRITLPAAREFLAVEDLLPAGLEVVDLSLKTSSTLAPFETATSKAAKTAGDRANPGTSKYGVWYGAWYGTWYDDWWSPWEHQEIRDDRVVYFARALEKGTYVATYVARATTAGTFIRPPAHAEEMYNQSLGGRSEGGIFRIVPK